MGLEELCGGVRLWGTSLFPFAEGKPEGSSRVFRKWYYAGPLDLLHWRIAHGHIWAESDSSGHKIALEDLPLLDVNNAEKGAAELRKKYSGEDAGTASFFYRDFLAPCYDLLTEIELRWSGTLHPRAITLVERDFLPTGPNSWDLFILYKSRLNIWHACEQPPQGGKAVPPRSEQCGKAIPAGFHEPFFVYGKPEAPFFVTKSGKVFQCLYPKGKEPRVIKIWDDPKRQVRTILNDADTNRTFVAGPDPAEGEGQWFYFELTEKPEKKPFDRSAVTAHAQEPLQSALIFARFLVKEGKIKDKAQ